ncbi:PREDICTED: BAG family molecular chaperone regulator 1 [Gekko japonicus]|uniref:BAG family molecular chaperone regulator 1 n=1 Tax=Gekko japonicus TaxID=146911 RepID=A0ABM1KR62_GEKJA|nr:PREDICTED: BAG family molecular chaperone regulator 1 [Gekko japonicus]
MDKEISKRWVRLSGDRARRGEGARQRDPAEGSGALFPAGPLGLAAAAASGRGGSAAAGRPAEEDAALTVTVTYGNAALTVTVTYGSEKHNLRIASQEEDSQPTVRDMALLIEQVTGVPLSFQKLIYKGKSLKEMEQPLSTFGVKNGCKVMLIGKRNSPEEETELKKLKDLEKSVEQIAKKIEEVNKELGGIQKGFLAKNLQTEALSQLEKRIKGTAEQFMKILEQIDAIAFPENFSDCKQKKKGLVKKVQAFLAQCDTVEGSIGQEMDKLQSKNMALAE